MKNKTILAVWNAANCGKTETLRRLAILFKEKFPSASFSLDEIPVDGDFRLIIIMGDIKIAIESKGDPKTDLQSRLIELDELGCNLIICTCRTKGETVNAIINMEKTCSFETIWTSTYQGKPSLNYSFLNNKKAEHIFDLLMSPELLTAEPNF